VATVTERLPVLFIPHKVPISLVRHDVVDLCGRRDLSLLEAFFAIWMAFKKALCHPTPCRCVSTLRRRLALTIEEPSPFALGLEVSLLAGVSMPLAILLAIGHSVLTARVRTK
jgi:hypothetical protein